MSTLKAFENQQYLNLETYRKTGQAMPTPVWFVEHDGVLYVRTVANSGKVKRIRNNGQVRVAPCDMRGELKGDWLNAQASLLPAEKQEEVNGWLNKKYGLAKVGFDLMGKLQKSEYTTVVIQVK